MIGKVLAVYAKDIRLEIRNRYALNAILLFGITALAVVSFAMGRTGMSAPLQSAVFWVVVFFSAMAGLAHVFVREEETGTAMVLRLKADPDAVYVGKLLFNFTMLSLMAMIVTPLFFIFTDAPADNVLVFILVLALGVVGLCAAMTLVAAIIARASGRGALFAVLSFPIVVPLLFVLSAATEKTLDAQPIGALSLHLQFLVVYSVLLIVASVLLFKFVWRE